MLREALTASSLGKEVRYEKALHLKLFKLVSPTDSAEEANFLPSQKEERETFLLNLNAEQLQAYAFGSESALADETQPVLVNFEDGNYVMSFLVRNGGQENTDGYSTDEISYHLEFTPSLDEEWIAVDLQTVTNSSGLPTPPTGYTYLSHQLQTTEEPKLFVRVRIEVN